MARPTGNQTTSAADVPQVVLDHDLAAVVVAARAGDGRALPGLIEHIWSWLSSQFIYADHPVHGGAQDAVHDVCERILHDLPRYRGSTALEFFAWLAVLVRDVRIRQDTVRARDQRDPAVEIPDMADPYDGPEEAALRRVDRDQLRAALHHLTSREQELLDLRFAQDVAVAEVAQRFGQTDGAVRVMQHRALRRLRPLLAAVEKGTLDPRVTTPTAAAASPRSFVPLSAAVFTGHPYDALPRETECLRCQASIRNGHCG